MWELVANLAGLKELRVKFKFPIRGWMGWSEREVLKPLRHVTIPLEEFTVEVPTLIGVSRDEIVDILDGAPYILVEVMKNGEKRVCVPLRSPWIFFQLLTCW
jgi:hypothetical protein